MAKASNLTELLNISSSTRAYFISNNLPEANENTLYYDAEHYNEVMNMSLLNDREIPEGLGMALAQNMSAMQAFSNLDDRSRDSVVNRARQVKSRQEMDSIVSELTLYE